MKPRYMLSSQDYHDKCNQMIDILNEFEEDVHEWDTQYIEGEKDFEIYDEIVEMNKQIANIKYRIQNLFSRADYVLVGRRNG
jgi:hypothetical protein